MLDPHLGMGSQQIHESEARVMIPDRQVANELDPSSHIPRHETSFQVELTERSADPRHRRVGLQEFQRPPLILRPALAPDQHLSEGRNGTTGMASERLF